MKKLLLSVTFTVLVLFAATGFFASKAAASAPGVDDTAIETDQEQIMPGSPEQTTPIVAVFGDSISWGQEGLSKKQTVLPIPVQVGRMLHITCDNYSSPSAGFMNRGRFGKNAYEIITSTDISIYNTFILQFGNNDIVRKLPVGEADSTDPYTAVGQMRRCIEYLRSVKPDCTIYYLATYMNTAWWREPSRAVLKEAAASCGVECIDYSDSPISDDNIDLYRKCRGAHINTVGYHLLSVWFARKLAGHLGIENSIAFAETEELPAFEYDRKAHKPEVTVINPATGAILQPGTDYTVAYTKNVSAGYGQAIITPKEEYRGTRTEFFRIRPADLPEVGKLKINRKPAEYSRKKISKTKSVVVTATVGGRKVTLKRGRDYKISYSHNYYVGKAWLIVTGKGNYTGSIRKSFKIIPRGTDIVSASRSSRKSVTVEWKKQARQTSGYQLQFTDGDSFKNQPVTTIKGAKKIQYKTKKLNPKRQYYVRIRTYKIVSGEKYFSKWSKKALVEYY